MRFKSFLILSLLFCQTLSGQEPEVQKDVSQETIKAKEKPTSFWMEKKLDYSTEILKGLSQGDFQSIEENAKQMRLLSKIEGFIRRRNRTYSSNLQTFERVTDEVILQSKRKNIEGVTLAYHQLVTSCVRCHQTLREPSDVQPAASIPSQQ